MNITVLYFARFREAMGFDREALQGEFATVNDVRKALLELGHRDVLAERNLMCARNEDLCSLAEPVSEGDQIAFFPTVTGG
ncbi:MULTISPECIES: MoaD/ThiS family protein [unclassified Pseudomonas]|uniref:MoaD/ThiS family protein n=1 Tax=unclassified Pseudomonas TaxID=196821 RepID=UPI000BD3C2BD|nr:MULTISPECIES: MoaD/ThiS family protein [unclassified Pseudomonas]PVZ12387.1 molybdopterin synthase sulfur carrier subunit [Pseudomonas sp. URIL14HWK12:I12]PVZ23461.1 molybdopterin synthase sulfur carrier subunit [Pseudomonas sp. URIL14HWK12:I10]PVZ32791.1 molybdopterin synthase sulfur carrier subunit [Pseudomonas sp. URIL14HWK12:I11]SNZ14098.1 molybdopterin synthase subunit MoaD [Pseudomonas sp. URIL14HWK12:I9]